MLTHFDAPAQPIEFLIGLHILISPIKKPESCLRLRNLRKCVPFLQALLKKSLSILVHQNVACMDRRASKIGNQHNCHGHCVADVLEHQLISERSCNAQYLSAVNKMRLTNACNA